ncbi:MAG TPA: hypothetical protein VIL16_10540 [Trebonia sp.]|jgi:hypothetical protein
MTVDRQATEYGTWTGWLDTAGVVRLGVEVHDADLDADEQGLVSVYWVTRSRPSDLVGLVANFDNEARVYVPELVAPEDVDVPLTVSDVAQVIDEDSERFNDAVSFVRADGRAATLIWQYAPCGAAAPMPVIAVLAEGYNPELLGDVMRTAGDGDEIVPGEERPLEQLIPRTLTERISADEEISPMAAH